jgi:hypothetical protein
MITVSLLFTNEISSDQKSNLGPTEYVAFCTMSFSSPTVVRSTIDGASSPWFLSNRSTNWSYNFSYSGRRGYSAVGSVVARFESIKACAPPSVNVKTEP